jgi:hypothetical protein
LNDCFTRFESIISSLRSCGSLAYSDNERAKQLLYSLDDYVWGIKITTLEESVDFATLDIEKLFSKFKSHELSRKDRPNQDASLTSKVFVTSTRIGGHVANHTNTTDSSALEFVLSSLVAASDEQYESIPDDEIPYWRESFAPCTGSARRGGGHRGAASTAVTPPTSSPTPSTCTTTTIRTTPATRAAARRSTNSVTRRRRRSSRR